MHEKVAKASAWWKLSSSRFNGTDKFQGIKLKAESVDVATSGSAELQSSSLNSLFIGKCKH